MYKFNPFSGNFDDTVTAVTSASFLGTYDARYDSRYVSLSGDSMTGVLTLAPSTTASAPLHFVNGSIPSAPSDGDMWMTPSGIFHRCHGMTHQLDYDTDTVGVIAKPALTVYNSGASLSAASVDAFLYSLSGWNGDYVKYTIPALSGMSLTDQSSNYLVVKYNAGNPIYAVTTDPTTIDGSSTTLAATLFREGSGVHFVAVDWGMSTANRLNDKAINLNRYERSSGLTLSVSAANINISSGVIWYGVTPNSKPSVTSTPNQCYFYYHTSSTTWGRDTVSGWLNTYYDDGAARQTLGNNNYVPVWVYRFVDGDNLPNIAYILGTSNNNLADAQRQSFPTSIPQVLSRMAVLVGRIIVQQGNTTAIQVDSAFAVSFAAGNTTPDHNSLLNLQGGQSGQYYHLKSSEYSTLQGVISGVNTLAYRQVSSAYVVQNTDTVVNCLSTGYTVILPDATSITGRTFYVKSMATGTITVSAIPPQLIDSSTTIELLNKDSLQITSTGSGWIIL